MYKKAACLLHIESLASDAFTRFMNIGRQGVQDSSQLDSEACII